MFRNILIADLESQDDEDKEYLKSFLSTLKMKPTGFFEVSETFFFL